MSLSYLSNEWFDPFLFCFFLLCVSLKVVAVARFQSARGVPHSDIFKPFGIPVYRFRRSNSSAQNPIFKFSFSVEFQRKMVAIDDFMCI